MSTNLPPRSCLWVKNEALASGSSVPACTCRPSIQSASSIGRGRGRPRAAGHDAERVLTVGGKAIQRVHGVRQAQARDVVRGGRLLERLHRAGAWLPPHQRRLHRRHAEERGARDALGGHEVALHQHGRQREHVGDVVEAVARVVLREVIGRPEVDAEQVTDRVVVLGPVEPSNRDAPGIWWRRAVGAEDLRVHPRR